LSSFVSDVVELPLFLCENIEEPTNNKIRVKRSDFFIELVFLVRIYFVLNPRIEQSTTKLQQLKSLAPDSFFIDRNLHKMNALTK
jgi:hypothetical protein